MIDISLIICTRNRASALASMLESLERITCLKSWEVVFVNNGSTDHTAKILHDFALKTTINFKVVFEPRAGLAAARNCGIRNSNGAILAFTDDDCYPDQNHLTRIIDRLSDTSLNYCGGQVLLFDPTDRPLTIQTRASSLELDPGLFTPSGLIHGANMAFRRDALMAINGFDERFGAGTFFKSGEDTDLLRRLAWQGMRGYYDPSIRVHHHHRRKTLEQEQRLLKGYDRGVAAVFTKFCLYRPTRRMAVKHFYWHARKLSWSSLLRQIGYAFEFARRVRFSSDRAWHHPANLVAPNITGQDK